MKRKTKNKMGTENHNFKPVWRHILRNNPVLYNAMRENEDEMIYLLKLAVEDLKNEREI